MITPKITFNLERFFFGGFSSPIGTFGAGRAAKALSTLLVGSGAGLSTGVGGVNTDCAGTCGCILGVGRISDIDFNRGRGSSFGGGADGVPKDGSSFGFIGDSPDNHAE